ncbi:hypothetical protein SO802_015183 [Lithocarpus litseifolius]|uniref:Uncharacterized protein n=1 Tax=Lithocarpus litseifolius TaxID=425828 RepID=A0AAW2CSZ0_9ROSI
MNTQELLNTIVASQIYLREDMNLMVQQFQNLKSNQEENKARHNPPTMESDNKINERMNKMEEMIRRARLSGLTRSGHCYTPEELEKRRKEIGKGTAEPVRSRVTTEEAEEFLKVIRNSE